MALGAMAKYGARVKIVTIGLNYYQVLFKFFSSYFIYNFVLYKRPMNSEAKLLWI